MINIEFNLTHLENDLLENNRAKYVLKKVYKEKKACENKRFYYTKIMEYPAKTNYYRTHTKEEAIKELKELKKQLKSINKDNKMIKKEIKRLRKHL